jgi:hypothetical protein
VLGATMDKFGIAATKSLFRLQCSATSFSKTGLTAGHPLHPSVNRLHPKE